MIFKVFGKTNNNFSKWVSNETVKQIKERIDELSEVQFYDMDKPMGRQVSSDENISYVPTVICENNEHELGYIENKFALGNDNMMEDMNRSAMWWSELANFVEDMDSVKKEPEDVV